VSKAKKTASDRNRNNRERGKNFERKMAKFLSFVRVPYSGSSELYGEGDIRDHKDPDVCFYLGECKSITPKSVTEVNFIIKKEWLDAIFTRAKKAGKKLGFLTFTKSAHPQAYVITKAEDFRMMTQALDLIRHRDVQVGDVEDLREYIEWEWRMHCGRKGEANTNESGDDESGGSDWEPA